MVEYSKGFIAVAHNGNLTNARIIKEELENYGSIFQSSTDTEVIIHLVALSHENSTLDRLIAALRRVEGSYSLLILTDRELIAMRDPYGFRPLVLGKLKDSYVVSSETCAFDLVEAEYLREIEPGEILHITRDGIKTYAPFKKVNRKHCIFEYIYFARPDSFMFGKTVYTVRKALGRELARDTHVDADMIVPIPDSGIGAAIGYSQETGIPFELGLIRNHYVGRTFIEPEQSIRHFGVKLKLNAVHDLVKGKRIIVIDDSIVRATTGRKIIKMLRQYGAKEVHFRVSSPPTEYPCFYGIDTPSRGELIAASHTPEQINEYMESDTLKYLTVDGMKRGPGKRGLYVLRRMLYRRLSLQVSMGHGTGADGTIREEVRMEERNRLLELLKGLSYEEGDFVLTSGKRSTFYIDAKETTLNPEGMYLAGKNHVPHGKGDSGHPGSGRGQHRRRPPWSVPLYCLLLPRKMVFSVFSSEKNRRAMAATSGWKAVRTFRRGLNVVILEDVVTTGGSSLKAIEVTEKEGYKVKGYRGSARPA